MVRAIKINGVIRFQNSFKTFKNEIGFKYATDQQLYDWGFREVITPEITQYQRLGDIYFEEYIQLSDGTTIGNYFTYPVIDFTQEEIDEVLLNEKLVIITTQQAKKQEIIQKKLLDQIELEMHDITLSDEDVLINSDFYDYWDIGINYSANTIVNVIGENQLYRCVQAHISQVDWTPSLVPALFTPISPPGVIPDFVQPTGAQDAYQTGDKVIFEGATYESLIDANVWSPTAYPAGWQLI